MPCRTRMKKLIMQGVLWLCLLKFSLVHSIIEPGYLDFDNLPDTNFSCVGKVIGGYYADLETSCQMFHVCTIGQLDEPMDIRFLCLNGTVFDQETRVCERVDEVDCSKSEKFYHLNLELYGNTAPPIVEEPDPTDAPKSTTTTPRPTTSTIRTTRATFYTTPPQPTQPPTTHATPKVITSNQFPVNSGPDIRFNPEEINIRLTPGSPPIIKGPSVSYQQHAYNGGDSRITVTTHSPNYKNNDHGQSQMYTHKNQQQQQQQNQQHQQQQHQQQQNQQQQHQQQQQSTSSSTQRPKTVVSYGLTHNTNKKTYQPQLQSYEYSYQQTDQSDLDYHTDLPSSEYSYHDQSDIEQYESRNKQVFSASTTGRTESSPNYGSSTSYPSSLKPPQGYLYQRTEKPPNLQLPMPLFPTLPPLQFSSPAPFSLTRHFEKKRSNDHQQRPRIIISASASVSDASGRRLNYSLGTIGTSHIIPKAPQSYDDYKEDDVGLDPFYHDVPKVKNYRNKRDIKKEEDDEDDGNDAKEEISTEELNTTHWTPPEYVDDNYEPLTYINPENETIQKNNTKSEEEIYEYYEYIDDNYEPDAYDNLDNETNQEQTETTSTVAITTVPSTIESNTVTESMTLPTTLLDEGILHIKTEDYSDAVKDEEKLNNTTTTPYIVQTTENILTTVTESLTTTDMTPSILETDYTTVKETTEQPTTTEQSSTTELSTTTEQSEFVTYNIETTLKDSIEQITEIVTENMKYITEDITASPTLLILTTEAPVSSTSRGYRYNSITRPTQRHRFSSPSIQMLDSVLKVHGNKMITPSTSAPDFSNDKFNHRFNKTTPKSKFVLSTPSTSSYDDVPFTDAPLSKSANPTEPKYTKVSAILPTTPITKTLFIPHRFTYDTTRSFNCFGREMNKFYEDPRDCRLFHYCTPGYTKTQVLDMKFVCDYGTYFDSERLICTKVKPQRCR